MCQEKAFSANELRITPAGTEDAEKITKFLNQHNHLHRHLDWYGPLDWLGKQPFLIELFHDDIQAILCATPENEDSAWIRTFAYQIHIEGSGVLQRLLSRSIEILKDRGVNRLAALAFHDWFRFMLEDSKFSNRQDIIVLEWQRELPKIECNPSEVEIRPMQMQDLPEVEKLDRLAFPSLWQNALMQLTRAFEQPGINTVAIKNKQIVGYQISTSMTIYAHLARLAVHPEHQCQNIAFHLVHDLLMQINNQGFWRITVNTQSDNIPSLNLYKKFGFTRTGEEIPVYEFEI